MGDNAGQRAFHNARLRKRQDAEVARLLERALQLHQAGVLPDAQAVYRQLLQLAPNHFDALHLLGTLESQARNFQQAETLLSRAVAADPQSAQAQLNRGVALNGLQRYAEARESYQKAIALRPNYAVALFNLGNVCRTLNRLDEAVENYDKAIAAKADFADAWYNRGLALSQLSCLAEAIESFDRALIINPRHVDAINDKARALCDADRPLEAVESYDRALGINPGLVHVLSNRGNVLTALERLDEALESYDRALAINRNFAEAHNGRGGALNQLRNYDEAIASFNRALSIEPDHVGALTNRASAWLQSGRIAEALPDCERALAIEPDSFHALSVLGQCLAGLGRIDQAIASFDKALAIKPDSPDAISSKIFMLDFVADADFATHQQVRRVWWEQIGSKIAAAPAGPHANDRDPRRRLVLGYVSSDFRAHSAARAFKPVLQRHDRTQFEIVCYSCAPIADATTSEFRQIADRWRDASQWNDARLAEQIRADGIDILVDLSGHSKGNRLGVFARKPAPVQVHGWGHATGTGLPTIDYMFSDPVAVPFEVRHLFQETIVDLPCALTLEPLPAGTPRGEAPALSNGYVTFGVFNRISKISDEAVAIWAQILNRLPRSRLLIKDVALDDRQVRDSLLVRFGHCGLAPERIDFAGASSRPDHLAAFNRVDICLDPFPQNGGVSTWEALQMGVPVVAKLGNSLGSRAAGAILCALGLPDWVAEDNQAYVEIAARRGARIDDLQRLRCELPVLIAAAPAGNPVRYAQAVDAAYLAMWADYRQRSTA